LELELGLEMATKLEVEKAMKALVRGSWWECMYLMVMVSVQGKD
jgi:hypothetical protein